jgi:hypothetical protein
MPPSQVCAPGRARNRVRHRARLPHSLVGSPCGLGRQPVDRGTRVAAADPQRGDRSPPLADRPPPIAHTAAARRAGGLDPPRQRGQSRDRVGAQPGIRRAPNIGLKHCRVHPQPPRAQHLALNRKREQLRVELLQQPGSQPLGQLHQRRGVRNPAVERDPTQPTPRERVTDLLAQRLPAKVMTML